MTYITKPKAFRELYLTSTMAKRNARIDDGFTEMFSKEIGFSHPRSVSRRISASEVLIFFSLTAPVFLYGFVTLSLLLVSVFG